MVLDWFVVTFINGISLILGLGKVLDLISEWMWFDVNWVETGLCLIVVLEFLSEVYCLDFVSAYSFILQSIMLHTQLGVVFTDTSLCECDVKP